MTENEAIERLKCMRLFMQINDKSSESKFLEEDYIANKIAIKALEEIQQYRAIGTVEECREARERQRVKDIIHNPDGGVDEDWLYPSCGRFCSPYTEHCQHCGQAVKAGDNP